MAIRGNVVGLDYVQAWRVGNDGHMYGTLGQSAAALAAVAAQVTMPPILLRNARSAQIPAPARVVRQLTGGNRLLGQISFAPIDLGSFALTLSDLDMQLNAIATESAVDQTTNSRWTFSGTNDNKDQLPAMGLMLTARYQSREAGSDGVNKFVHYLMPRVEIAPTLPQMSFQAEADVTYNVVPSYGERAPFGLLLSDMAMSLTENRALVFIAVTDNPLLLGSSIMDGTATTITLPYKPLFDTAANDDTPNLITLNGVKVAPASVVPATGVITLSGAGSDDDHVAWAVETAFEAVA
ncbi:MAG: hypothetical protein ACPG7F_00390 [Aggregatilineales bacterium]